MQNRMICRWCSTYVENHDFAACPQSVMRDDEGEPIADHSWQIPMSLFDDVLADD